MASHTSRKVQAFAAVFIFSLSSWLFPQTQVQVGYTTITTDSGSLLPVGAALFSYSNPDGLLVSQAGVAACVPLQSGRIFVDESGPQTGIALANVSSQSASINLVLRSSSGEEVGRKSLELPAGRHLPTFVFQQFPGLPAGFTGSLSFDSTQKLAAITLRQSQNRRGEPLYTTLPVADLSAPDSETALVFPQVAAGDDYSTQLILINTGSRATAGRIRFRANDGSPLVLRLGTELNSEFTYRLEPNGTFKADLDRPAGLGVGYAVVLPDAGMSSPSGSAVFQYKVDGFVVTEAGVGASPATTKARVFVDNVATYTGVALANTNNQPSGALFSLLDSAGFTLQTVSRILPPGGHIAVFAHELFVGLPETFTGLMEIRSQSPLNPITLKLTINQKNEQILTTLPVADLSKPPSATDAVFPQIAIGGGFSTRLIFINTSSTTISSGWLTFSNSDSSPMVLPIGGKTADRVSYRLIAGGGRQYQPGSTASISRILLVDPASHAPASEIIINEGNSVRTPVLTFDTNGILRDDFDITCTSINTEVASVDPFGVVNGKTAGFSTITVAAGGLLATGTITVVKVNAGVNGYEIRGIAQDQARRLYLAATQQHTILLAESLSQRPDIYAGKAQQPGLKDDLRKDSLFRNPASIAFNQADGTLYVSEFGNHVIRRVKPGPAGRVDTISGTGAVGSKDGAAKGATFNMPKGIALDGRGYLWVADSGNHTIRRLNLIAGTVETVSGIAGLAGTADGIKTQARFSSPTGIAIEAESIGAQLERESKGLPPPPVSVIVADEGSGLIRRVSESGEVHTIGVSGSNAPEDGDIDLNPAPSAAVFNQPSAVAVDAAGNILIAETPTGTIRTIFPNGSIVSAVQPGTLSSPRGIASLESGKFVVADSQRLARELSFGSPKVTSITPSEISDRGGQTITIRGANFSQESLVIVGGVISRDARVIDTQTISFRSSEMPSGLTTVTVQNRGGLAQKSFLARPVPLEELPVGYITTVAGGSTYIGDGTYANNASLAWPQDLSIDLQGNLYVADGNNDRVRRISAATGLITTIAGTGERGYSGDNGPGTTAKLSSPTGTVVDSAGNVFIAEAGNQRIRKISVQTGIITTFAGTGGYGYSGDNGPATSATFRNPRSVALDSNGNLFISDTNNNVVRKVSAGTGIITTVAGTGTKGYSGDNGPATSAMLSVPDGIAVDAAENLYIADNRNSRIRKVSAATGIITTVAGISDLGYSGDGGIATSAMLCWPEGVAIDSAGNIFIADSSNYRVRKISAATGLITTVAGTGVRGYSGDYSIATAALLDHPESVLLDSAGNLFIGDMSNDRIRKVDAATGIITTVAGKGVNAGIGDDGPATAAMLRGPTGLFIDAARNIIFADSSDNRVRKISAQSKFISSVAGIGVDGDSGDDGAATQAALHYPLGVAADSSGNIYVADTYNNRVRKVFAGTGVITAFAGNGDLGSYGDGGIATAASLDAPSSLAMDSAGNIYVSEYDGQRIRKVSMPSLIITTMAGNGSSGYAGDGGPATAAKLYNPFGIAVDSQRNIFVADCFNHRIRRIAAKTGIITTVAGTGTPGLSGDNGLATAASLSYPAGVAVDSAGNLFVADSGNNRIRKISAGSGVISTVAGTTRGSGFSGDGGIASAAHLYNPIGIAVDEQGNVYFSDNCNRRIRVIRGPIP